MSDPKVGNARRIVFTALALVSFWVIAWRVYWVIPYTPFAMFVVEVFVRFPSTWWFVIGAILALLPTALLTLSVCESPRDLMREHWIAISCLLFAATAGWSLKLGLEGIGLHYLQGDPSFWFFLPIILTTAFVIFGAWRRAVRDAAVEVAGEDE